MPNPKMETRATARPGLRGNNPSPSSLSEHVSQTRSRMKEGRSPVRQDKHDHNERSNDELSSDEDDADGAMTYDEVDRCAPYSSLRLYPDLSPLSSGAGSSSAGWSPGSDRTCRSPEESFVTARTPVGAKTGQRGKKPEIPLTPEKGSPGRKIHTVMRPEEDRNKKRWVILLMKIGFVVLILICSFLFYQSIQNLSDLPSTKPYVKPIEEVYKDIKRDLRLLNEEFSQTKHFWVQLIAQLDTIMVNNSVQPAVILTVVPEGAQETAVCLLHKISQAVSDSFHDKRFVMFDVKSELHKGSSHLKYELHNALLRLEDSHAAVVHNIEVIPGGAAMTFHAFCDNENAPFKQALIFLVITIPGKYEDLSWDRLENTIDAHLEGIWGEELMLKDVSAVVSRVANAPVLIKPETSSILKTACQNI